MKKIFIVYLLIFILCFVFYACKEAKESNDSTDSIKETSLKNKNFKIVIVMDTIDDWSSGIRDGFRETMDKMLAVHKSTAKYTIYDTELKENKAKEILKKIKMTNPDLICTINYPTVFADKMISQYLKNPKYKIVSENCIPVRSKIINSWEKPGGNITGVGVFVNMNSQIRLMKKLDPKVKKLVFYSWDAMKEINEWFYEEARRACKEEKIKLLEFYRVPHQEATFEFFKKYNIKNGKIFCMPGISSFVHKDGSAADDKKEVEFSRSKIRYLPILCYEETGIKYGNIAGACVVWYDIGGQLAEKGIRILKGKNPGDIAWDYPRKFNIILNLKRAKFLKIKIPQEIINAAYRIYTDYKGNFIGQDK